MTDGLLASERRRWRRAGTKRWITCVLRHESDDTQLRAGPVRIQRGHTTASSNRGVLPKGRAHARIRGYPLRRAGEHDGQIANSRRRFFEAVGGFDKDYFVQQVAGLTQIAGEFMHVKPIVIDLGWGTLKSALATLKDSGFVKADEAATHRQTLVNQYVAAFRHVESANLDGARNTLNDLAANISARVATDERVALVKLVEGQRAKLA